MKVLSIIAIVLTTIAIITFLFFRLNPAFGQKYEGDRLSRVKSSPNFKEGKFQNISETPVQSEEFKFGSVMWEFIKGDPNRKPQETLETQAFSREAFEKADTGITITWFGHSSALIKIDGFTLLADPVFSQRTSPVSFAGTKAFPYLNQYKLENLPQIDAIIISHDHYDHLDYKTINKMAKKDIQFFVPLGIGAHLERWGVPSDNITELDWWEEKSFKGMTLVATPSRHFSGRTGMNNKTLWCSWVIKSENHSVYFSGDSGYDKHFEQIGKKYGPFEMALIECGQYNKAWPYIHMMPEQSVQAAIDIKADIMLPIHWGRFNLSLHKWKNPVERAFSEATALKLKIITPQIGEIYQYNKYPLEKWWNTVK